VVLSFSLPFSLSLVKKAGNPVKALVQAREEQQGRGGGEREPERNSREGGGQKESERAKEQEF